MQNLQSSPQSRRSVFGEQVVYVPPDLKIARIFRRVCKCLAPFRNTHSCLGLDGACRGGENLGAAVVARFQTERRPPQKRLVWCTTCTAVHSGPGQGAPQTGAPLAVRIHSYHGATQVESGGQGWGLLSCLAVRPQWGVGRGARPRREPRVCLAEPGQACPSRRSEGPLRGWGCEAGRGSEAGRGPLAGGAGPPYLHVLCPGRRSSCLGTRPSAPSSSASATGPPPTSCPTGRRGGGLRGPQVTTGAAAIPGR